MMENLALLQVHYFRKQASALPGFSSAHLFQAGEVLMSIGACKLSWQCHMSQLTDFMETHMTNPCGRARCVYFLVIEIEHPQKILSKVQHAVVD